MRTDLDVVAEHVSLLESMLPNSPGIKDDEAMSEVVGFLEACRPRLANLVEVGLAGGLGDADTVAHLLAVNDAVQQVLADEAASENRPPPPPPAQEETASDRPAPPPPPAAEGSLLNFGAARAAPAPARSPAGPRAPPTNPTRRSMYPPFGVVGDRRPCRLCRRQDEGPTEMSDLCPCMLPALVGRPGLVLLGLFPRPFALARAALLLEGLVLGLHDALFLGLFFAGVADRRRRRDDGGLRRLLDGLEAVHARLGDDVVGRILGVEERRRGGNAAASGAGAGAGAGGSTGSCGCCGSPSSIRSPGFIVVLRRGRESSAALGRARPTHGAARARRTVSRYERWLTARPKM